jgi:hypothetical protein
MRLPKNRFQIRHDPPDHSLIKINLARLRQGSKIGKTAQKARTEQSWLEVYHRAV